jgi:hypothetical protein
MVEAMHLLPDSILMPLPLQQEGRTNPLMLISLRFQMTSPLVVGLYQLRRDWLRLGSQDNRLMLATMQYKDSAHDNYHNGRAHDRED